MSKKYFTKYIPEEGEITKEEVQTGLKLLCTKSVHGLRTEGKIYDACWLNIPSVDGEGTFESWGYISEENQPQYIHHPHEMKKVKLFLCSRDIQVGDKVKFKLSPSTVEVDAECMERIDFQSTVVIKDGDFKVHTTCPDQFNMCYKIIGEISPDALGYVKEGDAFDENQIKLHKICKGVPNLGLCVLSKCCEFFDAVYKIKGPCGHFH
jgi:hypothetical protein